jgi:hypothetical protein
MPGTEASNAVAPIAHTNLFVVFLSRTATEPLKKIFLCLRSVEKALSQIIPDLQFVCFCADEHMLSIEYVSIENSSSNLGSFYKFATNTEPLQALKEFSSIN